MFLPSMAQNVPVEKTISLKALVDNRSNKVIFVEADNDLIDVLFSFMTIPMGQMVRLARDHSTRLEIGCMNKLYQSAEKLDVQVFSSNQSREKVLLPKSVADPLCQKLKLKIIDCVGESRAGGAFVDEQSRVIITDDLQVITPLSDASNSFFTNLGDMNSNTIEEQTFCVGDEQVLNLLLNSLVSKTPFSETLLKNNHVLEFNRLDFSEGKCIDLLSTLLSGSSIDEEKETISINLVVSKTKNMVCYAEVRKDFVNLLFSFLTLPLGYILKQMLNFPQKGCIGELCKGVLDFDEDFFRSDHHKELLCCPKVLPGLGFSYENSLIGIEEARCLYDICNKVVVRVLAPGDNKVKHNSGYGPLKGPAVFTVTDNLDVRLISPTYQISFLRSLNVPITDIERRKVLVGRKEALSLLVSSFVSDSVLTKVFLRKPEMQPVKQKQ